MCFCFFVIFSDFGCFFLFCLKFSVVFLKNKILQKKKKKMVYESVEEKDD